MNNNDQKTPEEQAAYKARVRKAEAISAVAGITAAGLLCAWLWANPDDKTAPAPAPVETEQDYVPSYPSQFDWDDLFQHRIR